MGLLRLGYAIREVERVHSIFEMKDERVVRKLAVFEAADEVESAQVHSFVD